MATWQEEIELDDPTVWLRLDVEGAASNGQTVPGSVNDFDGELLYSGSEQVWGFSSFVETVPSSRAYRGFGDGSSGLVGHSRIIVPHDSSMAVTNDFACEGGVQVFSPIESAGTFGLIWKQGPGGIGLTTVGGGIRLCAFCFDSAATLWVAEATFVITDFLGVWFHVAAERVGNQLALYINGNLENTETITSGLPTASGSNPFRVHSDPGFYHLHYDEALFYTHANGGARYLAHYEAAINATLLNGDSNVVSSAVLYSDVEPTPVEFPFRHNWSDSLIERISFRTNQSIARKGYSENGITRPKPRREIEISQVLRDNSERSRLRSALTAQQNRKWFVPILEDREQLTTTLSAGATTIPVTTQYKDYEVDSWAELRQLNNSGQIVKSEVVQISAVNANDIETTATVNSYDALLSTVSPARRARLSNSQSLRGHSGAVEDTTIFARLLAEDEKVVPNRITPWTPNLTYKSYEVYNPLTWQSNDWSEFRDYEVAREQETVDFDAGSFEDESDAIAAVEVFSYRMTLEGRDRQAALLGWFYARAGAARYLWVPTTQADFEIVSELSNTLTVTGHNYSDNFAVDEFRRDLAFVYHDNTMALRRITSVTAGVTDETLTLNTTVPTLTNLRSVSYLRFCQLDGDTLEIARVTDTKARFAWAFRELLASPD